MQQVQECVCVNTVKRLTTCEASPWSHSPRRSCWTGRWWSWGPGWATRSLPGRIASPTTTSSGGTPRTCGTSKALCWFFLLFTRRTAAACWGTRQTSWTGSFGPAGSSSPPGWTAWCPASRTSAWSTCTAARRWWTWTPRQCADSRRPEGEGKKKGQSVG